MSDKATTRFPVMGDEAITANIVNVSGNRSPYTIARPKGGGTSADDLASGTGARSATMTNAETLGPLCKPVATLYYPNAASHADTGRQVKVLPPSTGASGFWDQR